jgi:hypothetical protein
MPNPPRGVGRIPGSLNKRTISRIKEVKRLTDQGMTPLLVMTDNMVFWHRESLRLGALIKDYVGRQADLEVIDKDTLQKLIELMSMFFKAREMAQACARDAAPYMHPKLAAVTMEQTGAPKIQILGGLPDEDDFPAIPGPVQADPGAAPDAAPGPNQGVPPQGQADGPEGQA